MVTHGQSSSGAVSPHGEYLGSIEAEADESVQIVVVDGPHLAELVRLSVLELDQSCVLCRQKHLLQRLDFISGTP